MERGIEEMDEVQRDGETGGGVGLGGGVGIRGRWRCGGESWVWATGHAGAHGSIDHRGATLAESEGVERREDRPRREYGAKNECGRGR